MCQTEMFSGEARQTHAALSFVVWASGGGPLLPVEPRCRGALSSERSKLPGSSVLDCWKQFRSCRIYILKFAKRFKFNQLYKVSEDYVVGRDSSVKS